MGLCCTACFSNRDVVRFIEAHGQRGRCDYCHTADVLTCATKEVGAFIREGLSRAYRDAHDEVGPYDREDERYVWGDPYEADSLFLVLQEETGLDSEPLAEDLIRDSAVPWHEIAHGAEDPFPDLRMTVRLRNHFFGAQDTGFHEAWKAFRFQVMHVARFFDGKVVGANRAELLDPVLAYTARMELQLPPGTVLWRARPAPSARPPKAQRTRALAVGPAPVGAAKRSRMSPRGISYMYLGDSVATCTAEVLASRPSSRKLWLGSFVVRRRLRLVDLTYSKALPVGSIFSRSYDHSMQWASELLRDFAKEISMPVGTEDEELEYVPTQVLSEFLRVEGFDGIKYPSAQARGGGVNYVLFCGPPPRRSASVGLIPHGRRPGRIVSFTQWMSLRGFHIRNVRSKKP